MANSLPPNLVKAVVREVMQSKNAILDTVLDGIAAELAPLISEHAYAFLYASIDPDPREVIFDEVLSVLINTRSKLDFLLSLQESPAYRGEVREHMGRMADQMERVASYLQARRRQLRGEEPDDEGGAAAKGGAT